MKHRHHRGFSMLETMLAIIVVVIAGFGVYEAFNSGLSNNNIADAENEVVEIANVYTDLASSNLTDKVTDSASFINALYRSGRLSSKYFSTDGTVMYNTFGALDFSAVDPTPYSYAVTVPLGCLKLTSSLPQDFYKKVQDVYSCANILCERTLKCPTSITLYFNLNS